MLKLLGLSLSNASDAQKLRLKTAAAVKQPESGQPFWAA